MIGCKTLPTEKLHQYSYKKSSGFSVSELTIKAENPLLCPLRVYPITHNDSLRLKLRAISPILLPPQSDTTIKIPISEAEHDKVFFLSFLGDLSRQVTPEKLELPFLKGKRYKIIQGNNGGFSHRTSWSRYAIDFGLRVNDTICAAADGYVVGLVEQYKHGGSDRKWKPYGNFLTIYHPKSGYYTQYVHLVQKGSLVQMGDFIKGGQPIGMSGKTGQTTTPHLHFNCLIPTKTKDGLKSVPFEFSEGYKSGDLKKNAWITK